MPDRSSVKAQDSSTTIAQQPPSPSVEINPQIIENSPVLQRWLKEVPDVLFEIENDPSFRTRFRLGYSQFPSTNQISGVNVGVEDLFIAQTGFTISADYQTSFTPRSVTGGNDRVNWGAGLQYYLRPLGSYINVAPVIGYRRIETSLYTSEGLNVGAKLFLVLSRGGGADLAITQTWLAPGTGNEVGMTTLSAGYALTYNLRLSTDIQFQNSRQRQDSRVGIVLEWMP
ncbi:MAG: hypothetical protein SFW36_02210 [Leptolyngbyaceae cyanobacterium bins.59]|nr:hypothetical protein [Leptolyngbyaceae cyanobacterium bins.59]